MSAGKAFKRGSDIAVSLLRGRKLREVQRGATTFIKAVMFDFIGTLTNVKGYDLEVSKAKLYKAIVNAGFEVDRENFMKAYDQACEKYRIVRYQNLVEVTNAIWVSEALNSLGFKTGPDDPSIKTAVNAFFEDYLSSLELRRCVKRTLKKLSEDYKLGLISNFTYSPVIYAGLRKLNIGRFFNVILVSDDVGWRKPHVRIFEEALRRLNVKPGEAVHVGDSPTEDVKGAKELGIKTIFVPSQFYSIKSLNESGEKPDLIVNDICELCEKLRELP